MLEVDDEGNSAPLGKHVTGQEYNAAPAERRRLGALAGRRDPRLTAPLDELE